MKELKINVVEISDGQLKIDVNSSFYYHETIGILDQIKNDIHNNQIGKNIKNEVVKTEEQDNQELDINKWAEELRAKNQISTRLYNFLTNPKYFKNINIKTLDKYEFIKYRGCGVHYWNEFVKLRGY
jgi:hypothetical protein